MDAGAILIAGAAVGSAVALWAILARRRRRAVSSMGTVLPDRPLNVPMPPVAPPHGGSSIYYHGSGGGPPRIVGTGGGYGRPYAVPEPVAPVVYDDDDGPDLGTAIVAAEIIGDAIQAASQQDDSFQGGGGSFGGGGADASWDPPSQPDPEPDYSPPEPDYSSNDDSYSSSSDDSSGGWGGDDN